MNQKEMKMTVSGVCPGTDGKKKIYVQFQEGKCQAEGRLPDCKIIYNKGFDEEAVRLLEFYMKKQQTQILEMAKNVSIMGAFMK